MRVEAMLVAVALALSAADLGRAQPDSIDVDELLRQGEQWARQNIDPDLLRALNEVDRKKVLDFLNRAERELRGQRVLDLAGLKETAQSILPLLDRYQETRPYADWLRARLAYFVVAGQLRSKTRPAHGGAGAGRLANPAAQLQTRVWQKYVATRPPPAGAAAYARALKPIFVAHGVPGPLVWLAEVESSFNPSARSPVGAVGLYQLMPVTARENGLALSPTDERFSARKNAAAAAEYLNRLHHRFGNWPLALAAYNAGEGRVRALLVKRKAHSFSAIAARLPAETQMYVPRVNATLRRREGITLARLP